MNTVEANPESATPRLSAGQMLRAAREAQGLHLAMLSVKLKVTVRQLEALEAGQHDVLKGAAFERALAQAVCRQLRIDPVPVLAALPQAHRQAHIEPVAIEARHSAVRAQPANREGKGLSRQVLVLALLMLLGAAALIWWPNTARDDAEEPQDPAQAAVPLGQASDPVAEPESAASAEQAASAAVPAVASLPESAVVKAPALVASQAAVSPAQAVASGASLAPAPLVMRLAADAWVEVRDSKGQAAIKRTVKAGETLQLSPSAPLFIYVSKADAAELSWQGKPVDLKPHTQNNEARLQIKP